MITFFIGLYLRSSIIASSLLFWFVNFLFYFLYIGGLLERLCIPMHRTGYTLQSSLQDLTGENELPTDIKRLSCSRSSTHGRGLNRFWSNVEGYKGPLLILVAASSGNAHEGNSIDRKWVLGALTDQGLENKDIFYGTTGCLYSISPVFHVFPPTGM